MKIQSLFTKAFWLALACITLVVVTVFKLTPSLAYSTTTPPAQLSTAQAAVAQYDSRLAKAPPYDSRSPEKSLYKRLGGYNAIAAVIDDTAQIVFNDPLIGKYFIGLSTNSKQRLRQLLVDQFTQAAGGPAVYTGRSMKLSHSGIGLTNAEYDAFVNGIAQALDKNGVNQPEKDEVLAFANSFRGEIVER
ncbi:group 1 truncated hemoglobin [Brasilonema octagenarum UFV-E1]|uniref:Group 1 truncated hemoglobin n=1 Tax=Brasilonema sennae CENA114 TaxID=415709 RepID=A0A856MBZ2_9CYAN|nr:group 1 truncated hemoglobin [Brasilonema sennae]QDL07840.1 group 1 truncated hemoglobin [Brasilonema sennae CENA114]QDL14200.1 group 1 truncated hemoglobin [Brasilonema octagenarum UFV-E1]